MIHWAVLIVFNLWVWAGYMFIKECEWNKFNPTKIRKDGVIRIKDVTAFALVLPAVTLNTIVDGFFTAWDDIMEIRISK